MTVAYWVKRQPVAVTMKPPASGPAGAVDMLVGATGAMGSEAK